MQDLRVDAGGKGPPQEPLLGQSLSCYDVPDDRPGLVDDHAAAGADLAQKFGLFAGME
jgi:hypothetical protein